MTREIFLWRGTIEDASIFVKAHLQYFTWCCKVVEKRLRTPPCTFNRTNNNLTRTLDWNLFTHNFMYIISIRSTYSETWESFLNYILWCTVHQLNRLGWWVLFIDRLPRGNTDSYLRVCICNKCMRCYACAPLAYS